MADVRMNLQKINIFLSKLFPLLKPLVWEVSSRSFSSVFKFCKIKGCCYGNVKVIDRASGIHAFQIAPKCQKIKEKTTMSSSLWQYHYFITGSGVTTIFFYKELDQKFWNRKYPCLKFVQYRDWGKLVIPNVGWMFPIQSYSTQIAGLQLLLFLAY